MDRVKDFLGPRPGWAFVRVDQGKVELGLRIAVMVFSFITFIPAAVLHTNVSIDASNITEKVRNEFQSELQSTATGSEWIIVVCWACIFSESFAILLRFLNLELVERYIGLVLIGGIVLAILFIISWFCGAIFFAVKSSHWQRLHKNNEFVKVPYPNILHSVAATSSLCFFTLFAHIALLVWMFMWLFLRWQQLVTDQLRYRAGPSDRYTEDLAPEDDDDD